MKYDQYRQEIEKYDMLINAEQDKEKQNQLLKEAIDLNERYIAALKKPIPAKIVFCVLLSLIYLLGLMIFLPQIIIRKSKIRICQDRISKYNTMLEINNVGYEEMPMEEEIEKNNEENADQ